MMLLPGRLAGAASCSWPASASAILINLGTNWLPGRDFLHHQGALRRAAAGRHDGLFHLPVAQLQRAARRTLTDESEAMAKAIHETLCTSVLGSSITTVAGFIALCFMSFTMGRDLGIVMAKGVLLGVIGCVTVLPSLILLFDQPAAKDAAISALIPHTPTALHARSPRLFPDVPGCVCGVWLSPAYMRLCQNQRRSVLRYGSSACRRTSTM